MNFKKLIAAFSAGVISISALASVAVSAKEQKALNLTFDTMFDEEIVEGEAYLIISSGGWVPNTTVKVLNDESDGRFIVKGVSRIYFRQGGRITDVDGNLDRYFDLGKNESNINLRMAPAGAESSDMEMIVKYRSYAEEVLKGDIGAYGSNVSATNVTTKSTGKLEGYTINKVCRDIVKIDLDDEEIARCDVEKLYRDVREDKNAPFLRDINAAVTSYEDATITFVFDRDTKLPEDSDITGDYDWNSAMKAVSLVINGKKITAKPEIKIGKDNCTITYKWSDIKSEKEAFEKYSTIQTMVLETNNDYLDEKLDKKNEVMDLELISVNINAPEKTEKGETVEDFSAGAGCVVNETAL